MKCMGGCPRKNKNVWGGHTGFFPVRPPLRISNGIALLPDINTVCTQKNRICLYSRRACQYALIFDLHILFKIIYWIKETARPRCAYYIWRVFSPVARNIDILRGTNGMINHFSLDFPFVSRSPWSARYTFHKKMTLSHPTRNNPILVYFHRVLVLVTLHWIYTVSSHQKLEVRPKSILLR